MSDAFLAVPGELTTPTGGYAYARRVLKAARAAGWQLEHVALPGGFPDADRETLVEAGRRLAALLPDVPVIVDGLALGVMPPDLLAAVDAPLVALCHHPLCLETGLAPARATELREREAAALAMTHAAAASSAATAADMERLFGVAGVVVARPGTDPAPPARGSPGAGCVVLAVGSLTPRKGHARLVKALSGAGVAGPWTCRLVGPEDRDPGEAARLRALVAEAGLADRISFDGALGEGALARAYDGADLFALPSLHEGFGMAFAEAVARHLPVLAPDLPSVAEAVTGGAMLLPPEDAAWTAALRAAIGSAGVRADLARQAAEAAPGLARWSDTAAALRTAAELARERAE